MIVIFTAMQFGAVASAAYSTNIGP